MSVQRANFTPEDDHIPEQTTAEAFKLGGPEAFDIDDWYWTSTECTSGYAWVQGFDSGTQHYFGEDWSRSEEHTSELQSLMRISYAVFCLQKKKKNNRQSTTRLTNT